MFVLVILVTGNDEHQDCAVCNMGLLYASASLPSMAFITYSSDTVTSFMCSYYWWYHTLCLYRQCSLITGWNINNVSISDSHVHPDTLLHWLKKQVALYDSLHVEDVTHSFKNGLVLCAIIHRYRPDLLDFHALSAEDIAANNQLAFDTLERELGIPPVSSSVLCVIYGNFLH